MEQPSDDVAAPDRKITGMVRVFDPIAYLGSVAAIVVACAIAAAVPAARAAQIDPMTTLKQD